MVSEFMFRLALDIEQKGSLVNADENWEITRSSLILEVYPFDFAYYRQEKYPTNPIPFQPPPGTPPPPNLNWKGREREREAK